MNFHWLNHCLSEKYNSDLQIDLSVEHKKVNRKVKQEPQAEVAANPWHQEQEKKWHRLTCA